MRKVEEQQGAGTTGQVRPLDIGIEHCPHYGGALKTIATIEEFTAIRAILSHPGVPARAGCGVARGVLLRRVGLHGLADLRCALLRCTYAEHA